MKLYDYQIEAINKLSSGKILYGDVGSGKSLTSIAWYYEKACNKGKNLKPLFIITTAKKRDDKEWIKELGLCNIRYDLVVIDSWNNIKKYTEVKNSIFIFDEQRLIGSGVWVKSFYKIAKNNEWILLTGTPGDSWSDYIPVFVANGFYRNKTDFSNQHIEWDGYSKFPKIKAYHNTGKMLKYKNEILVRMECKKDTTQLHSNIICSYDELLTKKVIKERWDIFKDEPLQQASTLCYVLRRITNQDISRIKAIEQLFIKHNRMIIFYNFNYELELLREMCKNINVEFAEWNGHKHEQIPETDDWIYLVQYTAGNEGWNCTSCDTIVFYSSNYSYKVMVQSAGRIDRVNTPFEYLYYYHLTSNSVIDRSINQSLRKKKNFNEKIFERSFTE